MALRRHALALAAARALVATCVVLAGMVSVDHTWVASASLATSAPHHPSPTPTPQPTPTPHPTPTPPPTPPPTPAPIAPPTTAPPANQASAAPPTTAGRIA